MSRLALLRVVVLDGLGGAIGPEPTALERAHHPHLDALARRSAGVMRLE